MANMLPLEQNLKDVFTKSTPPLPPKAKQVLVEWAPWLSLIAGVLSLWGAWALWHWANVANAFVDYANSLSAIYGGQTVVAERLTAVVWVGIAVLIVEGLIYLLAFPGLRDRKKSGWNLLYWGALVNIAYGVVVMFTAYGGFGNLLMSLIGTAIGMYLLFQIRSAYSADAVKPAATPPAPAAKPEA